MAPRPAKRNTPWNAVGILRGSDPSLQQTAVLLSAHLDHLGIGPPVNGDDIYNGADDDASGTTAVLELARVLGSGPKPQTHRDLRPVRQRGDRRAGINILSASILRCR